MFGPVRLVIEQEFFFIFYYIFFYKSKDLF